MGRLRSVALARVCVCAVYRGARHTHRDRAREGESSNVVGINYVHCKSCRKHMTSRKVYRKARLTSGRSEWPGSQHDACTRILKEAMMANNALCWKLCGNCANDNDSGLCTLQQARPQSRRLARTPMACHNDTHHPRGPHFARSQKACNSRPSR